MTGKIYALTKNAFQKVLHSMGLNLVRYNAYTSHAVLLQTIIRHFGIATVLDVGANEGQYASELLSGGFKGKIFSFEPLHDVFRKLEKNTKVYKDWYAFNQGLGSQVSKATINVSENLVSSSILPIAKPSLDVEPTTRSTRTETIEITTVDDFLLQNDSIKKPIMLKLDVQGYELEALKGSLASLEEIRIIQAELSLVPTYEGAPLYQEVIQFLEEKGFELYSILPGFMDGRTGRLLQADGIFLNKNLNPSR